MKINKIIFHILFWFIAIYHLFVFLGNFFLIGPLQFEPTSYLFNDKPLQEMSNGVIRMLPLIWGLWYLGTILGVAYAYFKKSAMGVKAAVIAPAFYNIVTGFGTFTFLANINVFNTEVVPLSAICIMHFVAAGIFVVLFILVNRVFGYT